ncbi:TetR family transcriptional regulator [Mycobacterium sp. CBMA271]|uniref:TetR/AcrR family transcriptional regulator n=1 Tax=unclassified Mycobacteroides TaxID=2618759 RepID=UPI0012DD5CD7|nr:MULTISPECIES: TetR/AcrR family transcriptional regulator [unclassified Mycobacteroides]MUM15466.1 TetR family transcriptional regulator [Mycobacteroides sp. CBMA 326]MUM23555.1 TetR family transcriptional regulator [Mycobacteroides sp. CBMA 271]
MPPLPGLREQKKSETKLALSRAALELAQERGDLAAVTIDDIADAVRVSPRTFRNYFTSKEDAVLFSLQGVEDTAIELLRQRPGGERVLDSLEAAIVHLATSAAFGTAVAVTRLSAQNPGLAAHAAARPDDAGALVLAEVSRRAGLDSDVDLYPLLVCNAAYAVLRTVIQLAITKTGLPGEPGELVAQGFQKLRDGLA